MHCDGMNNGSIDGTEMANKIIDCVTQIQFPCGITHIATVLAGKRWKNILTYGHENIPCFGTGSDYSVDQWSLWIHELVASGYLFRSSGNYPVIRLTDKCNLVKEGNSSIELSKPVSKKTPELHVSYDKKLFKILKEKRLEIAQLKKYPAYVIFHDRVLAEMCRSYPCTMDQLISIKGVGEKKADQYGEDFLSIISQYMNENHISLGEIYHDSESNKLVNNIDGTSDDIFANAYDLQEYILSLNKEINEAKQVLNSLFNEIKGSGIQQNGAYKMVYKEHLIRVVDQDKFFRAYPDAFVQYARIPISKAELVTGLEEIDKYITKTVRESYRIEKLD